MKHLPSNVKDKYEILSVIGEGKDFYIFLIIIILFIILKIKGSYGVVLKARRKVLKIKF
jgi:hypothetical protein